MGVVTAATSLIDALVKKNPDEYRGCVSLAVSRLVWPQQLENFKPSSWTLTNWFYYTKLRKIRFLSFLGYQGL